MFHILPFVLIVASLGVILIVIIKKFPQLSLLDVDSLPEVKEEKKKEQVLKKRAKKKTKEVKKKQSEQLDKFLGKMKTVQHKFRGYVGNVEKRVVERGIEKKEEKKSAVSAVEEKPVPASAKDKMQSMLKHAE